MSRRVRFDSGQGFWPAIWMLGYSPEVSWPHNGEIDIMEHLNQDSIVYQTVHTAHTASSNPDGAGSGSVMSIDPDGYNIYSVVIESDRIMLLVNDQLCHTYVRKQGDEEQFVIPFTLSSQLRWGDPGWANRYLRRIPSRWR